MRLSSFTIAQSILTALLVFSALAVALQMTLALGHRLFQMRQRMFRARVVAAFTDPIIELLAGDVDEAGRRRFIASLPSDAAQRAVVVEMLLSSVVKVRGDARETVSHVLEEAGFTEYYLRRLGNRAERERAIAAEVLGEMRATSAMGELLNTMRDPSPVVRVVAARALGKLAQAAAVSPLLAEYASGRLPSGIVASSLLRMGPAAGPALQTRLRDDDPRIRALCANLIGLLDWIPACEALLALLDDEDATVRRQAAESAGRLGADTATEPLLACLRDIDRGVRVAAAEALGRLGDPAAAWELAEALTDDEHDVRLATATALMSLGATGPRVLSDITRGGDPQARAYAIEVLQRTGHDALIATPAPALEPAAAIESLPIEVSIRVDTRVVVEPAPATVGSRQRVTIPTDGALRPLPEEIELPVPPELAPEIALLTLSIAPQELAERAAPLM